MTRRRIRRLVGFFVLSFAVAVGASVALQGLDNHTGRSTTPVGYVGIVSANFYSGDTRDEIIGDFGTGGVWAYHNGTWTQLTASNPDWIFAAQFSAADYELICDFGSLGLWMWNYNGWPGDWVQLTASNAEQAIAIDDDNDNHEELQVDFGSLGMWHYDWDTGAWVRMTALNPVGGSFRIDLGAVGWDEGLWEFSGMGLWAAFWGSGAPVWYQLTSTTSADDAASGNFVETDANEELIIDFSGIGTWLYDDGAWTRLTYANALALTTARFGNTTDDEVIFADTDASPWWWGGSVWHRLLWTPMEAGFAVDWNPNGLTDPSVEEELAVDFGTQGLWRYDYGAGWTQLTASDPAFMVRSDYFQDGKPTALIGYFPGVGLWIYDSGGGAHVAHWMKLTDTVPNYSVSW